MCLGAVTGSRNKDGMGAEYHGITKVINLRNSMEQSPSWEASSHPASQEIPLP
jgi:hypothetical protein